MFAIGVTTGNCHPKLIPWQRLKLFILRKYHSLPDEGVISFNAAFNVDSEMPLCVPLRVVRQAIPRKPGREPSHLPLPYWALSESEP
jgi:hypothetical protein